MHIYYTYSSKKVLKKIFLCRILTEEDNRTIMIINMNDRSFAFPVLMVSINFQF